MKVILLAVVLLGLGIAGIAVKIWGKKGGEFAGDMCEQQSYAQ